MEQECVISVAVQGATVELREVSKRFGATLALDRASVAISPGTIHALVGENGAGKSTLGKIIGGVYVADSGELRIDESDAGRWNPSEALAAGIATIQQELSLVPVLTVAANVFLGIEESRFGILRGSVMERYQELDQRIGFGIPGDAVLGTLRLADQQKVEILRALAREARLIVLDEPTSSLTLDEADRLHDVMRDLRAQGRTLVYVSHFLEQVLEVADRITIMRDGQVVRTRDAEEETKTTLIEGMLGQRLGANFPVLPPVSPDSPVVYSMRGASGAIPKDITLDIREGEILGIAGLVGSGRTELARMIAGVDTTESGQVSLDGARLGRLSPKKAINHGIVMVPEDRRRLGLILTQNTRENVTLPRLTAFRRRGRIDRGSENAATSGVIERLGIVPPEVDGSVKNYSGGNQQKVLFGKWTLETPRLAILDEPTRGVDIGAKQSIYNAIVDIANTGAAVLLISSELEEVLYMSHRIMIMVDGRCTETVEGGALSADSVLQKMFREDSLVGTSL